MSTVARPFNGLSLLSRLLLTTDGTVTTMLDEVTGERIRTEALKRGGIAPRHVLAALAPDGDPGPVLTRSTLLVGTESGTVYVRARVVLAVDALPGVLGAQLASTGEPIGRLLRRHRVETFRELAGGRPLRAGEDPDPLDAVGAEAHSAYPTEVVGLHRTYLIHIGGRPAIFVGEVFTEDCLARGRANGIARPQETGRTRTARLQGSEPSTGAPRPPSRPSTGE